jgi:uncharacterized protein YbjT (DUF2867 family)
MNITVTGATGFIGSRLTQELLDAGHVVHTLGRRRPPSLPSSTWPANPWPSAGLPR